MLQSKVDLQHKVEEKSGLLDKAEERLKSKETELKESVENVDRVRHEMVSFVVLRIPAISLADGGAFLDGDPFHTFG